MTSKEWEPLVRKNNDGTADPPTVYNKVVEESDTSPVTCGLRFMDGSWQRSSPGWAFFVGDRWMANLEGQEIAAPPFEEGNEAIQKYFPACDEGGHDFVRRPHPTEEHNEQILTGAGWKDLV